MSSQQDGSTRQQTFTAKITLKHQGGEVMWTANMATRCWFALLRARRRFEECACPARSLAPRFGIAARFQDKKAQRDSIANSYQPRNRRYGIPVPQFPEPTRAKAITKWEGHCRLGEIIDVRPEIEVLLLAVDSSADFRLRIPG